MRLCMNLSIFLYTSKQKLGIVPVGGNYINKLGSNLMIQVIRFMQNLDVKFQYETGSFGIADI